MIDAALTARQIGLL